LVWLASSRISAPGSSRTVILGPWPNQQPIPVDPRGLLQKRAIKQSHADLVCLGYAGSYGQAGEESGEIVAAALLAIATN
jgi:hypothetical protein